MERPDWIMIAWCAWTLFLVATFVYVAFFRSLHSGSNPFGSRGGSSGAGLLQAGQGAPRIRISTASIGTKRPTICGGPPSLGGNAARDGDNHHMMIRPVQMWPSSLGGDLDNAQRRLLGNRRKDDGDSFADTFADRVFAITRSGRCNWLGFAVAADALIRWGQLPPSRRAFPTVL